jgi:hypothetical protein
MYNQRLCPQRWKQASQKRAAWEIVADEELRVEGPQVAQPLVSRTFSP